MLPGAMLAEPLQPGEPPKMTGSAIVVAAETEEEVKEFVRNDIYTKGGAWNADKATIIPVGTIEKDPFAAIGAE